MFRRALLSAAALLCIASAHAGPGDSSNPNYERPGLLGNSLGYCQLAITTAAKALSACTNGVPNGANYAVVCNEGSDAVRWRDDGTNPTGAIGQILGAGTATAPTCAGFVNSFSTLVWIAESGTATLDISFYQ